MKKNGQQGQIVIIFLVLMATVAIIIPALVSMVQQEQKWSVKKKKSTVAFHLAEAGIDRAKWKLNQGSNFDTVKSSGTIANYNNDKVFTDIAGGTYKILMTTGSESNEVRVVVKGRDSSTAAVRTIEVIFYQVGGTGALTSLGTIAGTGSAMLAHWGPLFAYGTNGIQLAGAADVFYPRKYSRSEISDAGATGHLHEYGESSSWPTSDDAEYWAYNNDFQDAPDISMSWYKDNADYTFPGGTNLNSVFISTWDTRTPDCGSAGCGSSDDDGDGDGFGYDDWDKIRPIIYVMGDTNFPGSNYLRGTLVAEGQITFTGGGDEQYFVPVPSNAVKEYPYCPGAVPLECPHATGWPGQIQDPYDVGSGIGDEMSNNIKWHGFIYTATKFQFSGNPTIVGKIRAEADDGIQGSGTPVLFYDAGVDEAKETLSSPILQKNWHEIAESW